VKGRTVKKKLGLITAFALAVVGLSAAPASATPMDLTFNASADAYTVSSAATTAHGTTDSDSCFVNDSGPTRRCYLGFTVSGLQAGDTVTSAKVLVRLKGGGGTKTVEMYAASSFDESTLTWNNQPALGTAQGTDSTHAFQTDSEFSVNSGVIANGTSGNGSYYFALAPTNISSGMNFYTKENTVGQPAPRLVLSINRPQAPVAHLTATPQTGDAPLQVTFDASGSTDADNDIVSYTFDPWDGTTPVTQSSPTFVHEYEEPGTYIAAVNVQDASGLSDVEWYEVEVTEPPPPRELVVGASSKKPGYDNNDAGKLASMQDFDDALASAAGVSAPVSDFWHVYNGETMPTSWSSSNGAPSAANGWDSMTNIKWTPGEIRTTAGRDKFNGFLASIPSEVKVWLIGQHEPENDGLDAAGRLVWRQDQAEFIKLVIDFDPDGDHVVPMSIFMGDPPVSWDEFDFFPLLRAGDIDKMICGWDAYPKARAATSTLPDRTDDPGFKYNNIANWYRDKGCTRLGIGETTLNNDANVSQTLVDEWWAEKLPTWLQANEDVEIVAIYDSTGPASGTNGYIDTPGELAAVSDLMLNGV
jgi:PKD repeat protein